ncbi:MAG: hypothetical protein A2882_11505 [Phenylobacterium sp. RIFCSPHIGHO2_01_FULL_70_10]|nr:MAG: hypothetical protein A2882_11505 [Phenylobacterium sp. RIFCSPHIGHO2_01_FULL_70_10]
MVRILHPVADLGLDIGHALQDVAGGDQHRPRPPVGRRRIDQEPGAHRARSIAQRLFDLNGCVDQLYGEIPDHDALDYSSRLGAE